MDNNKLIKFVSKEDKDEFTFKIKSKYSNYLKYRFVPKNILSKMFSHFSKTKEMGSTIKEIYLGAI